MDIDSTYSTDKFKHLLYDIEDIEEEQMTQSNIVKAVENIRNLSEFLIYEITSNFVVSAATPAGAARGGSGHLRFTE